MENLKNLIELARIRTAQLIKYDHEYKGYRYEPSEDRDDDVIKINHDVRKPDGTMIMMDWSPYSTPTGEEFATWVDLRCPERRGCGPLDRADLEAFIKEIYPSGVKR